MRIFKAFAVLFLAVTALVCVVNAGYSCKNDEGAEVSWFFIYKFPNSTKNVPENTIYDGADYVYVDSNTNSSTEFWELSSKKIDESDSALGHTIADLTKGKMPEDLTYALYNDEGNFTQYQRSGHTKGLFMFGEDTGLWLIHSVPSFPNIISESGEVYPKKTLIKGQMMLCVTFRTDQLETIAKHLILQEPHIYASASALNLESKPYLEALLRKKFSAEEPWYLKGELIDAAGNKYISFSTHKNFPQDAYSSLVYPALDCRLLASTWLNGAGGKLPGSYEVDNVKTLTFTLLTEGSASVENTVDHSNWAVCSEKDKPYVCVGTLNRKDPKKKRGGETLCFENQVLHKLLLNSVTAVRDSTGNTPAEMAGKKTSRTETKDSTGTKTRTRTEKPRRFKRPRGS